jgi:microcystin-dependent protein
MGLGDIATAAEFRDWTERTAAYIVEKLRPASFTAEVTAFDINTRKAMVRTAGSKPGDPDLEVNYLRSLAPNQIAVPQFGIRGNVVEIEGRPGSYFITRIYSGLYTDELASPSGIHGDFSVPTPPVGWLVRDGSAISRTFYSRLFAHLGTTHGAGDGSTTFNLPNDQGRVGVGLDPNQIEFDNVIDKGGAKTVALSIPELPSHNHTFVGNSHTFVWGQTGLAASVYLSNAVATGGNPPSNNAVTSQGYWTQTNYTGGGVGHLNLQPYYVELKCIKI